MNNEYLLNYVRYLYTYICTQKCNDLLTFILFIYFISMDTPVLQ